MARIAVFVFIALLVFGVSLAFRGFYVWNTCGYDCGIFTVSRGIAAIVAMPVGLLVSLSAAISLAAIVMSRGSGRG
jgi:uncharacterized membrane protein